MKIEFCKMFSSSKSIFQNQIKRKKKIIKSEEFWRILLRWAAVCGFSLMKWECRESNCKKHIKMNSQRIPPKKFRKNFHLAALHKQKFDIFRRLFHPFKIVWNFTLSQVSQNKMPNKLMNSTYTKIKTALNTLFQSINRLFKIHKPNHIIY